MNHPVILIPSRLDSVRFPRKPLVPIEGKPMLIHVMERAREANLGPVYVASPDPEIVSLVTEFEGKAILTSQLPKGTDCIHAALETIDPQGHHDLVINVQGDMPFFDSSILKRLLLPFQDPAVHMTTFAFPLQTQAEKENPNVVKIVCEEPPTENVGKPLSALRAIYFSRAPIPYARDDHDTSSFLGWHHAGIYAYRRSVLNQLAALPPSPLEHIEKLEQLRALENGLNIWIVPLDAPLHAGIDTPADLEQLCSFLKKKAIMNII